MKQFVLFALAAWFSPPAFAQDDSQDIDPPPALMNRDTPVLSPEEALKAFVIEEGFEVQLVAAEPLVEDPVCMAWDAAGRLWVCEMRGYMPDRHANGEEDPTGKIVILEDTDADGVMDKRTVFLDEIVLPRAIAFVKNGILYADFEKLYFVAFEADGSAGYTQVVSANYSNDGGGKSNVEHQANGLLYGLDNWYYSAKSRQRFKVVNGRFRPGKTEFRGQWGITQDDDGRLLHNTNTRTVQFELFPPSATRRNANFNFGNVADRQGTLRLKSEAVWPIHPTPGVNRGYRPRTVDHETWKLKHATAVCGPVIYRADQFPEDFYNNVFIPEPAGNLLKRVVIKQTEGGKPTVEQAYTGREFLASTDERNRFVNAYVGPDGCLYLVDMYRGLIQHKTYISEYYERQIISRGLEKPLGLGRIYRVVYKGNPVDHTAPNLSAMTSEQLVALLGHANAWHRETAQRLLVERSDPESAAPLERVAVSDENPQARIHALWALHGMGKLKPITLAAAGSSENDRVRRQVLRLAEQFAGTADARRFVALMQRYDDEPGYEMDLQLAFTAGVLASLDTPEAYDVLLGVLDRRGGDKLFRNAVISGLQGKEAVMLGKVGDGPIRNELTGAMIKSIETGDLTIGSLLELIDSEQFADQREVLLGNLAAQSVEQNRSDIVGVLVDRMADPGATVASQRMILEGFITGRKQRNNNAELDGKPELFAQWQADPPEQLVELVAQLKDIFVWEKTVVPEAVAQRIENGKALYTSQCMSCHGDKGSGLDGTGPPLAGADWVQEGSPHMLAALVLNGLQGEIYITVNGRRELHNYANPMTPFKNVAITDQDIADILTYIRSSELNNRAEPVDAAVVAEVRELTKDRRVPYTPAQLLAIDFTGEGVASFGLPPESHVVKQGWLGASGRNLVITLVAVTVPLVLLLVVTLFGGGKIESHTHAA